MYTIEIDFKGAKNEKDIIRRFYDTLQLPQYGEKDTYSSWHALYDWLSSLDSDSKIISRMNPIPEHVHFILKNYAVTDGMRDVQHMLLIFMASLTDNHPDHRGLGGNPNIKITFEVHYGDY